MLASLAAFTRKRQIQPHRSVGSREFGADARITGRRKAPVDRRANVVELPSSIGQPSAGWRRQGLPSGLTEKIAIVLGMAARDPFALAADIQLLEHIGPGR